MMPMIDPNPPLRIGNSGPEYNNLTPGRHWPGFFCSDGNVGAFDLLSLLANWGPCP